LVVTTLRDPIQFDGVCPFNEIDSWDGASSQILGFSGERVFHKIVEAELE